MRVKTANMFCLLHTAGITDFNGFAINVVLVVVAAVVRGRTMTSTKMMAEWARVHLSGRVQGHQCIVKPYHNSQKRDEKYASMANHASKAPTGSSIYTYPYTT